jgi:hypothetical protein
MHTPTCIYAWETVKKVDRPNVGVYFDTFQVTSGEWGDPTRLEGTPSAARSLKIALQNPWTS